MYSEQLAVLLLIAATQIAGQGVSPRVAAQLPRDGLEQVAASLQLDPRQIRAANRASNARAKAVKREKDAVLVAAAR